MSRRRPLLFALAAVLAAWALAIGGMAVARHLKVTPEKVRSYLAGLDFAKLTPEQRRDAVRRLASMLNALTPEERRAARMNPEFAAFFRILDESERGELLELTLPAGFNQMLSAFEQLPEEKRRQAVEDTLRRMREQAAAGESDGEGAVSGGNGLSPELREKMVKLGVKTFMEQGSAETRAELQPVLEEMQRNMESGRLFRPGRRSRGE